MNTFNRVLDGYLCHYNRMFWLIFAIAGAMFIAISSTGMLSVFYLDIILGVALAAFGIHRIGDEFYQRAARAAHDDAVRSINELLQWAEKSYDYTRSFKDRHERRMHSLDHKRARLEDKVEDQFRSAVKKIIQMENKLNKSVKTLDEEKLVMEKERKMIARLDKLTKEVLKERSFIERRILELNQNQFKALQFLRDRGQMTNKEYRAMFRISDKKAYSELMALAHKGLIKRQGKGRSTHCVLAF